MDENYPAEAEHATAPIAVWWDIKDCPIPEDYDACRVRPSLVKAFKKLGYSGPVSITAYGDLKQSPDHVLRGLTSTGVAVAHSIPECRFSVMFSDILEWRAHNPPPATMMLISDQVQDGVLSWDLACLQQHTFYNLLMAYSVDSRYSVLDTNAQWLWKRLLRYKHETTPNCTVNAMMFYCKPCSFHCQTLEKFRKHLSSRKHVLEEVGKSGDVELDPVTRKWGKNYPAQPEYSTAPIAVWWDMNDCPVPEGYDAPRVLPSLQGEFKKLGYSGPLSITAYGDLKQTPDHLLRGLSSTGVSVVHSLPFKTDSHIFSDMAAWQTHNPPPATMMLISDPVDEDFALEVSHLQQMTKYNLFLAYSFRPYKMSVLVTSAEWLWDTLLAVSDTGRQFLQKCSERGESTRMFYCKSCYCDCKGLDHFRNHLSGEKHALEEARVYSRIQLFERNQKQLLEERMFSKRKRSRKEKTSKGKRWTGFGHIHLRPTYRGARSNAQKSQTCKKE